MAVTPIYNGPGKDTTKMYAENYGLKADKNLESDTIVGYYVQANYDASCEKVDAVTYYVMQSGAVAEYYEHKDWYNVAGDPVSYFQNDSESTAIPLKFTIPVLKNSTWTIPSMIVYFGEPDSLMKTGSFDAVDLKATTADNDAEKSIVQAYGGSKTIMKFTEPFGRTMLPDMTRQNSEVWRQRKMAIRLLPYCERQYNYGGSMRSIFEQGTPLYFAYKARVDMGTGDTYIYPDSSPTHYSNGRGQSFLRSPIVSVWNSRSRQIPSSMNPVCPVRFLLRD